MSGNYDSLLNGLHRPKNLPHRNPTPDQLLYDISRFPMYQLLSNYLFLQVSLLTEAWNIQNAEGLVNLLPLCWIEPASHEMWTVTPAVIFCYTREILK